MAFQTDPYTWFCRVLYFLLGVYLITKCKDACCVCCRDEEAVEQREAADDGSEGSSGGEHESSVDVANRIARRRELVRERLEIRKIRSPPSKKMIEKKAGGSNEDIKNKTDKPPDLEKGEGSPSTSMSTTHTRDTVMSSASDDDDDDDNNDPTSPSSEDNIRSKYSQRSFFAILFNPRCRLDPDDFSDSADDIATSIRSDSSFWISNLFNNSNGPGSESDLYDTNHEQECCSICLDPYRVGDTVARLKKTKTMANNASSNRCEKASCCNHWFHEECILEWLQNHDDCPLCRVDMIHN